jgi:hypothetical protein
MGRNKLLYIGAICVLGLALTFSLVTYMGARRNLRMVTSANKFLKKTVGEMAVAISAKDREINRLTELPCSSKTEPQPVSAEVGSVTRTVYE